MRGFKTIEEFTLTECEEFLKRNDISEEDRQRAEKRRDVLIANQETVSSPDVSMENMMDKFPEYKFIPSALAPLQRKDPAKYYYRNAWPLLLCWIIPGVLFFVISSQVKKKGQVLTDIADYISTSRTGVKWNYAIFARNRKFGLVNGINQIIIPAEYDKLWWASRQGFLFAEKEGKCLLFDRLGNKLTKEYDSLSWSDRKNILVAEKGGVKILVDVYGNELN